MENVSLLKQIIDVQTQLIEVMHDNLEPCFSQEDIDMIHSLELEIEQLKESYEDMLKTKMVSCREMNCTKEQSAEYCLGLCHTHALESLVRRSVGATRCRGCKKYMGYDPCDHCEINT